MKCAAQEASSSVLNFEAVLNHSFKLSLFLWASKVFLNMCNYSTHVVVQDSKLIKKYMYLHRSGLPKYSRFDSDQGPLLYLTVCLGHSWPILDSLVEERNWEKGLKKGKSVITDL